MPCSSSCCMKRDRDADTIRGVGSKKEVYVNGVIGGSTTSGDYGSKVGTATDGGRYQQQQQHHLNVIPCPSPDGGSVIVYSNDLRDYSPSVAQFTPSPEVQRSVSPVSPSGGLYVRRVPPTTGVAASTTTISYHHHPSYPPSRQQAATPTVLLRANPSQDTSVLHYGPPGSRPSMDRTRPASSLAGAAVPSSPHSSSATSHFKHPSSSTG